MSKLYLVPTPIGNLKDITFRAVEVLKYVDLILAEDTRISGKLLKHFEIKTTMQSYHMHNEHKVLDVLINKLNSGISIALISDAGTPAISDPGYYLIQECIKEEINFTLIPGPSSVINGVVLSGLPTSSFSFLGFVPRKKSHKTSFIQSLKDYKDTIILFESGKRIPETIECLHHEYSSSKKVSLCREMTKIHETIERGSIASIHEKIINNELVLKGEFVIVIEPYSSHKIKPVLDSKTYKLFLKHMAPKDAAKLISSITKENKRDVYKLLLEID